MAVRRETASVDVVINGEKAGETLKQLQANTKQLYRELQNLVPGTEEFKKKMEELEAAKQNLREITGAVQQVDNSFRSFLGRAAAFAGLNLSIEAATDALIDFGKKAVENFIEFEASLAELSSITGKTGDDLQYFAEQAEIMGSTTQSSSIEVVEAFKLMGSAVPSLLENKEALASVTKEAIVLAEASGIKLPESASAMAAALNMFQLPASESARIINSLAAGSKAGAVEVPQVTESLKAFGVAASSFNVSFEESVALIETMGEFAIKGSEAGTALRNVLNKMSTAQALPKEAIEQLEKFGVNTELVMNKQVPFNERLKEFSKIGKDAVAIAKVFGAENKIAGEIILNNVEKFENYTKAVTGTNTAYEQQAINADTTKAKLKTLKNEFEATAATVGGYLVKGFLSFIDTLKLLGNFLSSNKTTIVTLAGAYATYLAIVNMARINTIAMSGVTAVATFAKKAYALAVAGATAVKGFFTGATVSATAAMRTFSTAIKANPIGALVSLITLGVTALAAWIGLTDDSTEATAEQNKELSRQEQFKKNLKDATDNAAKSVLEEQAAFTASMDRLKQLNPQSETRKKLISEINEKYKDYLPNLLSEGDSIDQLTQKQSLANIKFKERIDLMVMQAQSKIYAEEIASLKIMENNLVKLNEGFAEMGRQNPFFNTQEALKNTQSNIKNLEQDMSKLFARNTPTTDTSAPKVDDKEQKEREKMNKKREEDEKKALENIQNMRLEAMEEGFSKEMDKLDAWHQKELAKVVGNEEQKKQQIELLDQLWLKKRGEIEIKLLDQQYSVKSEKEKQLWLAKITSDESYQKAVKDKNFDYLQKTEQQREQSLFDQKKTFLQSKIDTLKQYGIIEGQEIEKIQTELLKTQEEFNNKKKEIDEKYVKEKLAKMEQDHAIDIETSQTLWLEKNLADEEFRQAILDDNELLLFERETQKQQMLYDKEQSFLSDKLKLLKQHNLGESDEAKKLQSTLLTNQVNHNAQILENEKRHKEFKWKMADQDMSRAKNTFNGLIELLSQDENAKKKHASTIKALQTGNVIIDGIKEVQGLWAGFSSLGPIGQALAVIQTGIAVARTAMAINKINSTQYAKGGFLKTVRQMGLLPMSWSGTHYEYAKGALVPQGSSHAQGGISLIDNGTGQYLGEMEGGEPIMILSKATYANNKSLVDALLDTSLHRAGAPVYKRFAEGGIVDAQGNDIPVTPGASGNMVDFTQVVNEIRLLRTDFQTMKTNLKAIVLLQDIEDAQEEKNTIINNNTIS